MSEEAWLRWQAGRPYMPACRAILPLFRLFCCPHCLTTLLSLVFACSWVGFNILGPLQNQLAAMDQQQSSPTKNTKKRGVAAAVGLGAASLLAAQSAEAAQQVADLAASDNRFGTIALLAVPVLG